MSDLKNEKKDKEKKTGSNKMNRKRTKISGTVVRLLWRAAAAGLKLLRLPRAHLPRPRVNKTK